MPGSFIMRLVVSYLMVMVLSLTILCPALAVMPEEILSDPILESRARLISQDLRCLVCQNQSIDDSNAPLAKDLRVIVRERLAAGDSDAEVFEYVVSRYGNFVLLKPPFQSDTIALWIAPFVLLFVALAVSFNYLRKRPEFGDETFEELEED
jgi:cytochrome c-type biogenesis protein CcmH